MQIRKINKDDIENILEIENECFSDPWNREMFLESLEDDNCYFIGIDDEGKIIAYSIFLCLKNIEAQVLSIATSKEYQRRGLAKMLFEKSLEHAKNLRIFEYTLEVRKSNAPAIALYKSLGFDDEGIRPAYYSDGEDAIIMWRRDN